MRAVLVLLLAGLLTACAPVEAPRGLSPTEPFLTEKNFVTSDGILLPVRRWLPHEAPKAVVVALHGFNDYAKAFDKIPDNNLGTGPYLAAQGIAVFAYDQRGFGTAPHAGLWPGQDALIGDFRDFVAVVRQKFPGVAIYGLGESMGGAVIMTAVAQSPQPFVDGVILAAPAVWARSTMPFYYRVALWLGARFAPAAKPSGRGLGFQATDNIDLLRHNSRDPLFIKDTRIDSIFGMTNLMDDALASPPNIRVPTLYLYGQKDQIIPKPPTVAALKAFPASAPLHAAYYPNGWHIVLRDKQAEIVLRDVVAFIENPSAPLPSGADEGALERMAK